MSHINDPNSSSEYLDSMISEVAKVNEMNGWFDFNRTFDADIALLHSEVSEAYEGYRNQDWENVAEEMADIFIRLLDTCNRRGIALHNETLKKLEKNRKRGYHHGGKIV